MNLCIPVFAAFALSGLARSALAGPEVRVTFKNLGDESATYSPHEGNELITRTNSSPSPAEEVPQNGQDSYNVRSQVSPSVNYAQVRYVLGNKTCVFLTSFVATPGFAGTKIPKWAHSATPGGGATCVIRSTGVSLADYSWSVEMTMR